MRLFALTILFFVPGLAAAQMSQEEFIARFTVALNDPNQRLEMQQIFKNYTPAQRAAFSEAMKPYIESKISSQLPMRVDEATILTSLRVSDNSLHFTSTSLPQASNNTFDPQQVTNYACSTPATAIYLMLDYTLSYAFYAPENIFKVQFDVTSDDCGWEQPEKRQNSQESEEGLSMTHAYQQDDKTKLPMVFLDPVFLAGALLDTHCLWRCLYL